MIQSDNKYFKIISNEFITNIYKNNGNLINKNLSTFAHSEKSINFYI